MFQARDEDGEAPFEGEEGQGLVEYGLILGLIAMIAITAVMFLGTSMNNMFSKLGNSI
jgi:pilus assembly protein Flp/PilA